ncbi:outer membrane beta-barrel protein [Mucilaginibacter gilvus]|uniref:Outer membrane protein beta-barrel domain-containing protein n=1 Tax=Mucilaginibacter gilvus TaxID=2305909 RepID=A0A3S3WD44_9SPHI|nr:outer membrane beta-barrel protein [Mucilaginibacter gilvus]RWY54114.1 hypothetical protein EPL05_08710 [Mucilaginibacter gilvus]
MKTAQKLAAAVFTAVLLFIGANSFAQSTPQGKFDFNIGVDGLMPTGKLQKYSSNFGLGITPQLQYGLTNKLAVTFTSGYYRFFSKTYTNTGLNAPFETEHQDMIPVKLGLKAFITKNIYIGVEVGAGFQINDGISRNTGIETGRNTKLILAPGIGYATKNWDFGIRYENYSGGNAHYGTLGLRVTHSFGL